MFTVRFPGLTAILLFPASNLIQMVCAYGVA